MKTLRVLVVLVTLSGVGLALAAESNPQSDDTPVTNPIRFKHLRTNKLKCKDGTDQVH